jgi:hypothetical protein
MPCDEYEQLKKAWMLARRDEDIVYDPQSKKGISDKRKAVFSRYKLERTTMVVHTLKCQLCLSEETSRHIYRGEVDGE